MLECHPRINVLELIFTNIAIIIILGWIGQVIARRIIGRLIAKGSLFLYIGLFICLVGGGFIILATIQESHSDMRGFLGLAAFCLIIGGSMVLLPLLQPTKYGIHPHSQDKRKTRKNQQTTDAQKDNKNETKL